MPVWCNNVTGDGVVVSIIDDGESNLSLHTQLLFFYKNLDLQRKVMMKVGKTLFLTGYFTFLDSDVVTRASFMASAVEFCMICINV